MFGGDPVQVRRVRRGALSQANPILGGTEPCQRAGGAYTRVNDSSERGGREFHEVTFWNGNSPPLEQHQENLMHSVNTCRKRSYTIRPVGFINSNEAVGGLEATACIQVLGNDGTTARAPDSRSHLL